MTIEYIGAELDSYDRRGRDVTVAGAQAYERLLHLAETRESGQIARVARFLAATYNGDAFRFDLYEMRAVDVDIGDDMLSCIDALRWGRADLQTLVADGDVRVRGVLDARGCAGQVTARPVPDRRRSAVVAPCAYGSRGLAGRCLLT